jgi:hypothetical protein
MKFFYLFIIPITQYTKKVIATNVMKKKSMTVNSFLMITRLIKDTVGDWE